MLSLVVGSGGATIPTFSPAPGAVEELWGWALEKLLPGADDLLRWFLDQVVHIGEGFSTGFPELSTGKGEESSCFESLSIAGPGGYCEEAC